MSRNHRCILAVISLLITVAIAIISPAAIATTNNGAAISFSNMKVKANGDEGWLGGRSVKVKIVGTVTNDTNDSINEDDLPVLACIPDDGQVIQPRLKEKKLSPKDSCQVTYKGKIDVKGDSAPSLRFSGTSEFVGLDEAEVILTSKIEEINEEFRRTDEKRAKEEEKREAEEQERKKAHNIIEACVDKTADEALIAVQKTGYEPVFLDFFDVDVTEDVRDSSNGSAVHDAIVLQATPSDGWLLSGPTATFVLDYTDPEKQREREEEEQRKKDNELRRKNREGINNSVGRSAGKTQELVDASAYDLEILDSYGTDVTDEVRHAEKGSPIRRAPVSSVVIDDPWGSDTHHVLLSIDFLSRTSLIKIAKKKGYPTDLSISNIGVEIIDNYPASPDSTFEIAVTGSITNNGEWAVDDVRLPRLTTPKTPFVSCNQMNLTEGNTKLNPGETCNFVLNTHALASDQLVLKTPKNIANIQNESILLEDVMSQLTNAKQVHDENVSYYQEEQRRLVEEEMNNRPCYYTPNGSSYHSRPGCPALSRSNNIYETTVGEAKAWGLDACDRCH